jgi:hypothetical protein
MKRTAFEMLGILLPKTSTPYNQAPDFDDMSSFSWQVTYNVRVHINTVHDPLDIETYIL